MHEKTLTPSGPPQSVLERLDARLKLACLLVWVACIITLPPRQFVLLGIYAAMVGVILLSNARLVGQFARRFGAAVVFVVLLSALLPFFKPGQPMWSWGPLEITREGLEVGQRVAAAAILCVAGVSLVWASTSEAALLYGLRGVGLPALPVGVLGFMLRYLHVLRPELHRLTDARAARTIGRHGPGPLRSGANVLGTLFLRAHDRAERVADAMAARGYTGTSRPLGHAHWHAGEVVLEVVFAALVIMLRLAACS